MAIKSIVKGMAGGSGGTSDYNALSNLPDLTQYDNVSKHADLASFPAAGAAKVLYVDEAVGALYHWDGAIYVSLGGGSSTIVNDTLTSTSTTEALSANQGKVLDETKQDILAEGAFVDGDKTKLDLDVTRSDASLDIFVAPDAGSAQAGDFIGGDSIQDAINESFKYIVSNPFARISIILRDGEYDLPTTLYFQHPQAQSNIIFRALNPLTDAQFAAVQAALVLNDKAADIATLTAAFPVRINSIGSGITFNGNCGASSIRDILLVGSGAGNGIQSFLGSTYNGQRCATVDFVHGLVSQDLSVARHDLGVISIYNSGACVFPLENALIKILSSGGTHSTFHTLGNAYPVFCDDGGVAVLQVLSGNGRIRVVNDSAIRANLFADDGSRIRAVGIDSIGGSLGFQCFQNSDITLVDSTFTGNAGVLGVVSQGAAAVVNGVTGDAAGTAAQQTIEIENADDVVIAGINTNVIFDIEPNVETIVAGSNIAVDSTDPKNPIVSVQGLQSSVIDGSANTFADLPVSPAEDTLYIVREKTGTLILGTRKLPGVYQFQTATGWKRLSANDTAAYDTFRVGGVDATTVLADIAAKQNVLAEGAFVDGDKTKLDGIEAGATADQDLSSFETSTELNARDTANRNRANHTGTQVAATISDFQAAVQAAETTTSLSLSTNILTFTDEDGAQTNLDLSLYLDDTNLSRITSGTLNGTTGIATFTRDDASSFTVDMSDLLDDTTVTVNDTLTSTSTTEAASARTVKVLNDAKADKTQVLTDVPVGAVFTDTVYDDTAIQAEVSTNTTHRGLTTNPHSVTKSQVSLGSVDNTSDVDKPVSTAQQAAIDAHANSSGESHTFINQDVTTFGSPQFNNLRVKDFLHIDRLNVEIAAGVITPLSSYVRIDSEGATGADILTTIDGSALPSNTVLIVCIRNNGRPITIQHSSTLYLSGEIDRTLTDVNQILFFMRRTNTAFSQIGS